MSTAEITTILTNAVVLAFVGWAFFVRREADSRLDKLSKALRDATDLFVSTASWDKAAKEIEAMEAVLAKRHELEMGAIQAEQLNALKLSASQHIDTAADYAILRNAVTHFIPKHIKAMVWAMHVDRGYSPDALFVKCWETDDQTVLEARHHLKEAEQRRVAESGETNA